MLRIQHKIQNERHEVLTKEVQQIALSSNDDKRIQSIDSIEKYAYGTRKDLVSKKENINRSNIIERYKR